MLPLVGFMMGGLLVLTALAFGGRRLELDGRPPAGLERPLLAVSLVLYVPFLLLANAGMPGFGLLLVAAVFVAAYREVLRRVDWPLLAIFILMFIAFRSVSEAAALREVLEGWAGAGPEGLFLTGALLSQAVSNVPAAIVLAEFSPDWRTIPWGVSVGGFGTAIASLANIIALRMMGDRRAWVTFHLWAVPCLAVMLAVGMLWVGG